jgi:hypothetical protein
MVDQPDNRVHSAREQIGDAISLFLKGHFVSALTLAGAADEVLGKVLSHRGQQSFVDWKYSKVEPLLAWLHRMPPRREDFIRDENRALISVTQMESTDTSSVTLDLEDAAHSMIVRALYNYDHLGLPRTAKMLEFETPFYEYMVGRIIYA